MKIWRNFFLQYFSIFICFLFICFSLTSWSVFWAMGITYGHYGHSSLLGSPEGVHDRETASVQVWKTMWQSASQTGVRLFIWKFWEMLVLPRNHWVGLSILVLNYKNQTWKNQMEFGLQYGSAAGEDQEMVFHHNHVSDIKLWRMLGFF